jgi:hypothetical protein
MKYRLTPVLTTIALAGFLFCLLSALGITNVFCVTKGCEVYQGYTVFGISLYWIGSAVFLVLGMISMRPQSYYLMAILTGLVLFGNLFFLVWQFLMWPCTNCLIVAALLGSFAWLLSYFKSGLRMLCMLWLLLFSANLLLLAKDIIPPWPILGKNNAEIQVFFSPNCPACRQVVENLLHQSELLPRIAFYPLAKDTDDHLKIKQLAQNLKQGIPPAEAFAVHWQANTPNMDTRDYGWYFDFNLWRNQLHLAKKGVTQVPLVLSRIPLGKSSNINSAPLEGCSIFSIDSDGCEDNQPPDPFKNLFK